MHDYVTRRHPAEGVFVFRGRPTIVFLTVCSRNRAQNLANGNVHATLVASWKNANAWLVGSYLIMPDHIHMFCAPANDDCEIEHWISFWKRRFRRHFGVDAPRFQARGFHHRLRRDENYQDKWEYVRANPLRAGLVQQSDDWPYQGVLNELRW